MVSKVLCASLDELSETVRKVEVRLAKLPGSELSKIYFDYTLDVSRDEIGGKSELQPVLSCERVGSKLQIFYSLVDTGTYETVKRIPMLDLPVVDRVCAYELLPRLISEATSESEKLAPKIHDVTDKIRLALATLDGKELSDVSTSKP